MIQDINLYVFFLLLPVFIFIILKLISQWILKNNAKKVIIKNSHGKKDVYYFNSSDKESFDKDIKRAINFEISAMGFFKKLFEKNTSIVFSYNDIYDFSLTKDGKSIFVEVKIFINKNSFRSIIKGLSTLNSDDLLLIFTDVEVRDDVKKLILDINPNVKFFDSRVFKNNREANHMKNFIQSYLEN